MPIAMYLFQLLRPRLRRCIEAQKLIINKCLVLSLLIRKDRKEQPLCRVSMAASKHTQGVTYTGRLCTADRGIGQTNTNCVQYTALQNKY